MKVRINLLPPEHRKGRRRVPIGSWVAVACLMLAIVGTGGVYGLMYWETLNAEQELAVVRSDLAQLAPQLDKLKAIEAREEGLDLVGNAAAAPSEDGWFELLSVIRDLTPPDLSWLSVKADEGVITLTGLSRSLAEIAQLQAGLTENAPVQSVILRTAEVRLPTGEALAPGLLTFELEVSLRSRGGASGNVR